MVYIKGPEDWDEVTGEQEEHDFAYYFGIFLGFFGFCVLALIAIAALSWPLSWLWNIAAGPFDIPEVIWYEFAAGWVVMMILIRIVKNITGN